MRDPLLGLLLSLRLLAGSGWWLAVAWFFGIDFCSENRDPGNVYMIHVIFLGECILWRTRQFFALPFVIVAVVHIRHFIL